MALTKNDLQAIRSIVREEVKDEVSSQIQTQVRAIVREEVKQEVSSQLKPIKKELEEHSKLLNQHSKDLKYLRKTNNLILGYVDDQDSKLVKRVDRIETHLNLPPIS